MRFGNPSTFAIDVMTDPHLTVPSAVWGRMCIRLPEATIGDYADELCALFPVYRQLSILVESLESRWDEAFQDCSDEQVFQKLYEVLWQGGSSDAEAGRGLNHFEKFYFLDSQSGEQFNGYFSFLVCRPNGTVTILYQLRDYQHNNGPQGAATIDQTEFCDTVKQFLNWFDSEQKRLQGE